MKGTRTNGRANGGANKSKSGGPNGRTNGRADLRANERTDGRDLCLSHVIESDSEVVLQGPKHVHGACLPPPGTACQWKVTLGRGLGVCERERKRERSGE